MPRRKEETLFLTGTDTYYTHERGDAWHVEDGTALVYIVPWKREEESGGRRVLVAEISAGGMIPSFRMRDEEYTEWRFAIVAKERVVTVTVLPESSTNVLKQKFLARAGIETYEVEGYEGSLLDFYRREVLKDEVFLRRGMKSAPKVRESSYKVMEQALRSGKNIEYRGQDELYKVLFAASEKAGIHLPTEEQILSGCGREPSLSAIAEYCGFLCRPIVLEEKWYKSDAGCIIAWLDDHPAACVPRGRNGYDLCDGTNPPRKLESAEAYRVEPQAYSIARALPAKKLTRADLVRFSLAGIRRGDMTAFVVLGIIGALIGVLTPMLNQKIVDDYIPIGDTGLIAEIGLLIAAFFIANLFFGVVKAVAEYRIASHVGYDLQMAMYDRVFRLPEPLIGEYDSADLGQRVYGFGNLGRQIASKVLTSGFGVLFALVYIIRMLMYSWKLGLVSLLMLVLYAVLVAVIDLRSVRYDRVIANLEGESVSKLYQYIGGVDKLRMAGADEKALYRYMEEYAEKLRSGIGKTRIESLASLLKDSSTWIFSMVLYYLMIRRNMNLSPGTFAAFQSAFASVAPAVLTLVGSFVDIRQMQPEIDRAKVLTEAVPESSERRETIANLRGDLRIDHVSYTYAGTGRQVLKDLTLHIYPGEYVAIVGPSGSGKSTLLKLMLGFLTPERGQICYDGKDIRSLDLRALRRRLGVVLQGGKLIAGSIYENITITQPYAPPEAVEAVIDAVGLRPDIAAMPMGIHTVLSESGGTISGGQQQRILIARALISDPAVLFFDEATSALDNLTQAQVCETLSSMNATRVVIAHRLSTIRGCDRILVMEDGRIVEEGNYESLMRRRGLFYRMASRQIA